MSPWRSRRLGDPPGAGGVGLTVHELGSAGLGPTVAVLGGVHGDEAQGVLGAIALIEHLAAGPRPSGRVIVVPLAHEAAAAVASRVSPRDGLNLARAFPGDTSGTPTQRLAALLEAEVLADADLVLDLHSSGVHYAMACLVGYCDDGSTASRLAAAAATAMALPVMWRHPGPPPPGRSGSWAHARGRPFLYVESSEADDGVETYRLACLRLLAHLGLIGAEGLAPPGGSTLLLEGPGDLDSAGVRAPAAGLVQLEVELLDPVTSGQRIGWWRSSESLARAPLAAPQEGRLVMLRRTRLVGPGDLVALVTGSSPEGLESDGISLRPAPHRGSWRRDRSRGRTTR